ncbi:dicarboxylate/amino acid:cation symporter [Thermogladius calderae]|uniref:dicarboxylate/amino acid:cation symporter n=1 Tax=Thermogladius calderae TaxID=1200300 RepID=UPI000B8FB268|nr:dicarboxylate/amino acid:cation symporter [Thermogladius calderae]
MYISVKKGYGILIAIAFVLGLLIGYILTLAIPETAARASVDSWFKALGDIFVRLIRIVIPVLIFFTIAAATASIADARKLGIILFWMLVLYIGTSILASFWGYLAGVLFQPGVGVGLTPPAGYKPPTPPTGVDILMSFFQLDFSHVLTVGGSMTMIIFAMILGVSTLLLGEEGRRIAGYLKIGSDLSVATVRVIMYYAPIAIFGYAVWLMSEYGAKMLGAYGKFLVAQYSFTLMHFFVIYSLLVALGGLNPVKYFKAQSTPFIVAFTTRSSAVTLPYNMEASRKMGVPDYIYNITLPIGATVNMDGTALYQALSAMFIAQLFGIPIQPYQVGLIIAAATIGSVATAAIPGGGTIMLAYVLAAVGLPLEGIAIMMVIDPIADSIRTAINASGDNACTVLLTRIIGEKLQPQI